MNTLTPGDPWHQMGSPDEAGVLQPLASLFTVYGKRLQQKPEDGEANGFLRRFSRALSMALECNLNRR